MLIHFFNRNIYQVSQLNSLLHELDCLISRKLSDQCRGEEEPNCQKIKIEFEVRSWISKMKIENIKLQWCHVLRMLQYFIQSILCQNILHLFPVWWITLTMNQDMKKYLKSRWTNLRHFLPLTCIFSVIDFDWILNRQS